MTTPVATDDLVQGAVKWLSTFDDVLAVLGTVGGTDTPYLFQHTLWTELENTSSTAAVISRAGGWTSPNPHNTMKFPRISLEVFVDPRRDNAGMTTEPGETYRRADNAFRVIDARLHRPAGGDKLWGTVRTVGCTRLVEPIVYPVPDGDGMLRLQTFYGVIQG